MEHAERAVSWVRGRLEGLGVSAAGALLAVGLLLLAVVALWGLVDVVLLLFAGVLIAVLIRIPADWLAERLGLSGKLATAVSLLLFLLLVVGVTMWILPIAADEFDQLFAALPSSWATVEQYLSQYAWGQTLLDNVLTLGSLPITGDRFFARVSSYFGGVSGVIVNVLLVLVAGIYLAFEPDVYAGGIVRLVPPAGRERAEHVLSTIGAALKRWIIARLTAMVALALFTALGLWLVGVPLAIPLAVLAGVASFIPNIGALIAVLPALLLAFTISPLTVLYTLGVYIAAQFAEGYVVTPLVQRATVHLPPVLGLAVQLFIGALAGPVGLALAYPAALVLMVLVQMLYVEDAIGEKVDVLAEDEDGAGARTD